MAELRRVRSDMEPIKRTSGRRVLLPAEAELCNTVGLTETEYWYFVDLTDSYIPDEDELRNDPITIISLVVGLALSAVSALLAPKPQEPKKPGPNIKTEDIKGRSRFAPQSNFDSVQELSKLGAVVPLIFARKGVRVTSTLLWSQMLSMGIGQQLRVLSLFGSGKIKESPDFAGYAIGDTLLENYTNAKLALYFKADGGRPKERSADRYAEGTASEVRPSDAFSIYWDATNNYEGYFSGTRTPGTQTQFGVYAPIPNGNRYRVGYEVVVIGDDAKSQVKNDLRQKRDKINQAFPRLISVISSNNTGVVLRINGNKYSWPGGDFPPHGIEDIKTAINSGRIAADENLAIGNEYMVGTGIAVITAISNTPWEVGITKDITFKWIERGTVNLTGPNNAYNSYATYLIQRLALGTVSNNRACEVTEIGIKSTVYKQINGFANVNAYPGDNKIEEIEEDNGGFALGSLQTYVSRLSFFTLQIRELGTDAKWKDITGGKLFCVKGQTPQPHYNFIRISHSFGQYEYRMKPYPGNAAYSNFRNLDVWELRRGELISYTASNFKVSFAGRLLHLDESVTCNTEWIKGKPPVMTSKVESVSSYSQGTRPIFTWVEVPCLGYISKSYDFSGVFASQPTKVVFSYYDHTGDISENIFGNIINAGNGELVLVGKKTTDKSVDEPPNLVKGNYRYSAVRKNSSSEWTLKKEILKSSVQVTNTKTVIATGGSGSGLTFNVTVYANNYRVWEQLTAGTGYRNNQSVYIPIANVTVRVRTNVTDLLINNLNKYDAISDYVVYDSEKSSHLDNPEHEIVYVNEQVSQEVPQYDNLAISGLRINSSKEWTTFSNLSAFFKRGTVVKRLVTGGQDATNLLPEIAYALLTDGTIGAGTLIGAEQVDRERMKEAALFCQANDFTWDGVIDEKLNLREWIYEQAAYCLLDFTILGGRFSLVPSVPMKSNYQIDFDAKPEIKALFTDGNIRSLKVSFLGPEERQLFRAVVTWRQDQVNGFPETKTISVRLSNAQGGNDADPEEAFDMAGFCTSQAHALTFAKYALKLRKEVDHGLTFETTPQAAMNLVPGDYFRLVSEVTHTSRFNNGSIGPDGSITSVDVLNGTYPILYWEPGTTGVRSGTLQAVNNTCNDATLYGVVFTLQNSTTVDRVYKTESLTYAEDGLVEVAASYVPLTDSGSLKVLEWNQADFVVDVG